ncbi:hypothetical protein Patl1_37460 [Pistacia atlantica]|nr:hypothetical protein Patl1_37460 [Pistacia atlantica]
MHLLNKKIFGGNAAIRLDIAKAFDTLSWDFLLSVLNQFGFNNTFVNWIRILLNSAHLSILVNGTPKGDFTCSRGFRQGDPLSPLLFFFVLQRRGDSHSLNNLVAFINSYSEASGQLVNKSQSSYFLGKNSMHRKDIVASILGFNEGSLPFTYLGVPVFKGIPTRYFLQPIAVRKIGPLRKAELFGSLPLCGRPSYQSASFLLMEYNNARAPALLAFFTGARRMYHSSGS